MNLLPIKRTLGENETFAKNPLCNETLGMCTEFYKRVGFNPPWICYYVEENDELVGSAAFKGRPINNTVEISYGTNENYRQKGVATRICKQLVELSLATDPSVRITARTLPFISAEQVHICFFCSFNRSIIRKNIRGIFSYTNVMFKMY